MVSEKIKIKLIEEMRNQKIVEQKDCYILLNPAYIVFHADFVAEERISDDVELDEFETVRSHYTLHAKKEQIGGVEIEYVQKTTRNKNPISMWCITVFVVGSNSDVRWYVPSSEKKVIESAREKILNWMFSS